jgi:hypothetical protein
MKSGNPAGLIAALVIGLGELGFTWFKEHRFDRFVLFDTALLIVLEESVSGSTTIFFSN